ncbi:hypothetical protein TrVE_jg4677 [Triparma verrucosa]|uniref:Amine oxidase domain-containing protein n=1 Tax=Triparma verrucosa TaxID=1606542 RepID=A0A9W7EPZ4_9STRA|nr:hypothetical protein TrVE_jg4677 [Triparma verrucosa]
MPRPQSTTLICASIVGVTGLSLLLKYASVKLRRGVKGSKPFTPSPPVKRSSEITRDRFTKKKVPEDIDVVIVGSGIGGLYCAALLSKAGKRCLVLEQHYVAGGCTHCFEDKGWEFDTGVHYVGRVEKYGYLLDLVSEGPKVTFEKMGGEDGTYDEIKIGDAPAHGFRAGKENFINDLVAKFPREKEAIEKYIEMVIKCNKSADLHFFGKLFHPIMEKIIDVTLGGKFQSLASRTVQDVMDELFEDEMLKAILMGQFGDYGMPPSTASFFIHAGIVSHYLDGGFYPEGGPQKIAEAIIPTIEKTGGRVLVNADVLKINVENNSTTGVTLKNGTVIKCSTVISAAGAEATSKLVGDFTTPPDLRDGISHVYLFLGLKGSAEDLDLTPSNLWALPSVNVGSDIADYYNDPDSYLSEGKMLMFIGFPSSKDPTQRDLGKSTCVVISEAKTEWFKKWDGTDHGQRGDGYKEMKKKFGDAMLKGLLKHYPQLEGKVEYMETATPLTNMYYLRREASYGLQHPPERYTIKSGIRPQSDVKGLWITGQDVTTNGFAGALMGGVLTAHGVLGYGFWDLVVGGRDLITDMGKA